MNNNTNNPKKYKKSLFRRFIDFFKISNEMYVSDEEAEQINRDFDKLRSYKTGDGKRKWYVGG